MTRTILHSTERERERHTHTHTCSDAINLLWVMGYDNQILDQGIPQDIVDKVQASRGKRKEGGKRGEKIMYIYF